MYAFLTSVMHYVMGMAVVGATSALAVTGHISGDTAANVAVGVGAVLIGGQLGANIPGTKV